MIQNTENIIDNIISPESSIDSEQGTLGSSDEERNAFLSQE